SSETPAAVSATSRTRGLSTIELLCAASVALTAAGVSLDGMGDLIQAQRLKAAGAELESELQLARSMAIAGSQPVRLAIQQTAQGTCTLIHTGPKNACVCKADGLPMCEGDAAPLHMNLHEAGRGVSHLSTKASLAFSAELGTVTPTATLKLADTKGRALHLVVNVMGRVRSCSPGARLSGQAAC
uniref:GspH/FimT family pseudopilin n=1 Tax=Ideonella sp. A 288 TaxID=1962181 RepID=UPI000B4B215A